MTLGDLIAKLEAEPHDKVVPFGFTSPHSYRGIYEDLAFEPAKYVTVGSMLQDAKSALGQTFGGYKGGEYEMSQYTTIHLAHYGCSGEELGEYLFEFMMGRTPIEQATK